MQPAPCSASTTPRAAPGALTPTRRCGAPAGHARALEPIPAAVAGLLRLRVSPGPRSPVQPLRAGTHLGAGPLSAPAVPTADRRLPTPDPGPAPRAPPWVPPPGAAALRPELPRGPGRSPSGGPRPASERIPALLGAEPAGCRGARSLQRRGGRSGLGAGPRRGAGPGVAEAPRGRPPALRACAPRPAGPDATPGCLARGPGRAGEEPGLGCPRALSRAPQRPARHRPRAEDWAPG